MKRRNFIKAPTVLVAMLCGFNAVFGQATPTLDEPVIQPREKGDMEANVAVQKAIEFLKGCKLPLSSHPPVTLWDNPTTGAAGGTWIVRFGRDYSFRVHARTGRVMTFGTLTISDEVSKLAMMNSRLKTKPEPAKPVFTVPPPVMLLSSKSKFVDESGLPIPGFIFDYRSWPRRATVNEVPDGKPLVNGQPVAIWVTFDPRDGKLIAFERTADYILPTVNPKFTAAQAAKVAQAKASTMSFRPGRKVLGKSGQPKLGFALKEGDRGRPDRRAPLTLVWIVGVGSKEVWVDAISGTVVGGRSVSSA